MGIVLQLAPYHSGDRVAIEAALARTLLGKKPSSVSADKNAVSHFFRWNGWTIPSSERIFGYIDHARDDLKHSNKTIRGALVRLRRIFESWGLHQEFTRAMKLVRISDTPERRPIKLIPKDKVRQLIESHDLETRQGKRDRCLIALMLGGALRISEAINLTLGDVQTTWAGTLYVILKNTKKGVTEHQAIAPEMAQILREFITVREKEGANLASPILTTYGIQGQGEPTDMPCNRRNLTESFYRACKRINIKASPHSCRATSITLLLASGIPYREVREFSRHCNVAMVEIYDKRSFGLDDCAGQKLKF